MTRRGGFRSGKSVDDYREHSHAAEKTKAVSTTQQSEQTKQGKSGWLLTGGLLGGLVVIAGCAFAGYYLITNLYLGLALKDQPGSVYLPIEFDATASITNNMDIVMDGVIEAQVPFKQTLSLPLKGRYKADVEIDAPVPVKFDVVYDGTIPVDTIAD
ncbi:MAG: hypothetical protein ACPHER_00425, partial [Nevskiales bacterium]